MYYTSGTALKHKDDVLALSPSLLHALLALFGDSARSPRVNWTAQTAQRTELSRSSLRATQPAQPLVFAYYGYEVALTSLVAADCRTSQNEALQPRASGVRRHHHLRHGGSRGQVASRGGHGAVSSVRRMSRPLVWHPSPLLADLADGCLSLSLSLYSSPA